MPFVLPAIGVVELSIICVAIALLLLRRVWVSTFGHLLVSLADSIDQYKVNISVFGRGVTLGFGTIASLLRGINGSALHLLGAGINATEHAALRLWQVMAYMLNSIGGAIAEVAESTYRELRYLTTNTMPAYVGRRLHPLASKVEWLIHHVAHLDINPTTVIHRVVRVLDPRVGALERDVAALEHRVAKAVPAVLSPAIAVPRFDPSPILHGIDALRARIGKLSGLLAPAAIAGLVAGALTALRLGFLKCANVRRTAEHVCGMDSDLLANVLASTTVIFGTVSLVEFAHGMQAIVSDVQDAGATFWRA